MLLALNEEIDAALPKGKLAAAREAPPEFTIDPSPKPPCIPGRPCMKTIEQLQEFNETESERSMVVDKELNKTLERALDLHIKTVSFVPTQLPVYPEGTTTKTGPPTGIPK
jgi:hypothetical protein